MPTVTEQLLLLLERPVVGSILTDNWPAEMVKALLSAMEVEN